MNIFVRPRQKNDNASRRMRLDRLKALRAQYRPLVENTDVEIRYRATALPTPQRV